MRNTQGTSTPLKSSSDPVMMTTGMLRVCALAAMSCCTIMPLIVGNIRSNDEIGRVLIDLVQRLKAVVRLDHGEPREDQRGAVHLSQRRIVLDDQDGLRNRHAP